MLQVFTRGEEGLGSVSRRFWENAYPSQMSVDGIVIRENETHKILATFPPETVERINYTPRPYA